MDQRDPLIEFFRQDGQTIGNYLALDDTVVWSAASRMARGDDQDAAEWARRLLNRKRLRCVDVETQFPRREGEKLTEAEGRWSAEVERIDGRTTGDEAVIKDVTRLSAYGEIGGDQARAHKRLAIVVDNGAPREITAISDLIRALPDRRLTRYYFLSDEARRRALGGGP